MFRAYEPGRDRLVAVKVFRLDLTPEQSTALVAEFEQLIAKGISHPSIAAPIATGLESGAVFLAQEYAVGESLDVVLGERGSLPIADAVRLIESLAAALDAAAEAGVTHGALHPRDIILSADGARLTGIGVASALSNIDARLPVRTPYSALGEPSDVYSLAAIAFEAMSGRRLSGPHLEEFGGEHGHELRGACTTALALNPDLRPAGAAEFAVALRAAADRSAFAALDSIAAAAGLADADREESDDQRRRPPAPDFDPATLDRFAHAVAVEDLRREFSEPQDDPADRLIMASGEPAESTPFPASWSAQPPRAFLSSPAEPEPPSRRRLLPLILICGLGVGLALGYFLIKARTPAPTPSTDAAQTQSSVAETTVDLPATAPAAQSPAPAPAPPVTSEIPSLPAPTPSRPASGATAKPPARSRTAPAHGNLVIRSTPANADVTVNGQARGKTPITMRDLALGSYTIRVAREGYAPEQRRVQLTARRATGAMNVALRSVSAPAPAPVQASGAGSINVQSRPSGARVFVNNRLIGSTPLAIPGMPAGPATVRIEMDGYQTWTTTVHVNAGEPVRVNASLDRR